MKYDEALEFIQKESWGEDSDDTKVIARMLLEVSENLRIANLLKIEELKLHGAVFSAEKLVELGIEKPQSE